MLIAVWPLVFAVLGLLLWVLASHAKVSEAGRLLFFCGMFWLTYSLTSHNPLKISDASQAGSAPMLQT